MGGACGVGPVFSLVTHDKVSFIGSATTKLLDERLDNGLRERVLTIPLKKVYSGCVLRRRLFQLSEISSDGSHPLTPLYVIRYRGIDICIMREETVESQC